MEMEARRKKEEEEQRKREEEERIRREKEEADRQLQVGGRTDSGETFNWGRSTDGLIKLSRIPNKHGFKIGL